MTVPYSTQPNEDIIAYAVVRGSLVLTVVAVLELRLLPALASGY
jgi:hypothetical protein